MTFERDIPNNKSSYWYIPYVGLYIFAIGVLLLSGVVLAGPVRCKTDKIETIQNEVYNGLFSVTAFTLVSIAFQVRLRHGHFSTVWLVFADVISF